MINILFFIAGIALGIYIQGKRRGSMAPKTKEQMSRIREEAGKALDERTDERKEKILKALKEAQDDFKMGCNLRDGENQKGMTCWGVEELLGVSKPTALKYLDELEAEKKIEQVGTSGPGVYYVLAG